MDVPLEDALGLYGLDAATVFREPVEDSKALVAWGADTIVIAFRGTASFQNMLNDIQVGTGLSCASRPLQWLSA